MVLMIYLQQVHDSIVIRATASFLTNFFYVNFKRRKENAEMLKNESTVNYIFNNFNNFNPLPQGPPERGSGTIPPLVLPTISAPW